MEFEKKRSLIQMIETQGNSRTLIQKETERRKLRHKENIKQ